MALKLRAQRPQAQGGGAAEKKAGWRRNAILPCLGAPASFKRMLGGAGDGAIAVFAKDSVGVRHADPAQRHRRNPRAAPVTVLVVPRPLFQREARRVNGFPLIEDEKLVAARLWVPATLALARKSLPDGRLILVPGRHESADRVERREAAGAVLTTAKGDEFFFGH